jgi:hypothetical protein
MASGSNPTSMSSLKLTGHVNMTLLWLDSVAAARSCDWGVPIGCCQLLPLLPHLLAWVLSCGLF